MSRERTAHSGSFDYEDSTIINGDEFARDDLAESVDTSSDDNVWETV